MKNVKVRRPAPAFPSLGAGWRAGLFGVLAACAGCASSADSDKLRPVATTVADARSATILVATTRLPGNDPTAFTAGRSHLINHQLLQISIPPNHAPGEIEEAAHGPGDPARQFAAFRNERISERQFGALASAAARAGGGEVTVFVHGFNTSHEKAVFRLAQIVTDAGALGAAVAFTWPSRARLLDYITDRESVLFSRDRLEATLRTLARQPGVRTINVLAHSMGAHLVMETLRQAKLRGDGEFSGKLNAVVLASPDIDLDVFRTQLEVVGRRPRLTVLLVSSDDRALSLLRWIAGDAVRLGAVMIGSVEARDEINRLGLVVIDQKSVRTNEFDAHNKFAAAPKIIQHVGALLGESRRSAGGAIIDLDQAADIVDSTNR